MRWFRAYWLQILAHIGALLPLVLLFRDFTQNQLSADPIKEIQLRTGNYALILLMLTLGCTPVYIISGLKQVLQLRQLLGLYTTMYASLHFLNFVGLDYGFDVALIREDIFEKRYAVVGFATFLILLALALTSANWWRKRLGRNWKRLHRLIYAAAFLAILHFLWQVKVDIRRPVIYVVILAILLAFRIPAIKEIVYGRSKWLKKQQINNSQTDDI